jgi:hypothetical protein
MRVKSRLIAALGHPRGSHLRHRHGSLGLEGQHENLSRWNESKAPGKVEARMKDVAGDLKRDPRFASLVRSRWRELGIEAGSRFDRVMRKPNFERAISRSVRRERGLGLSR